MYYLKYFDYIIYYLLYNSVIISINLSLFFNLNGIDILNSIMKLIRINI